MGRKPVGISTEFSSLKNSFHRHVTFSIRALRNIKFTQPSFYNEVQDTPRPRPRHASVNMQLRSGCAQFRPILDADNETKTSRTTPYGADNTIQNSAPAGIPDNMVLLAGALGILGRRQKTRS